jgi:hypothetical protein
MKSQRLPVEWMGPATWRLPSGKALAEFALQAGFLAPPILRDWPRKGVLTDSAPKTERAEAETSLEVTARRSLTNVSNLTKVLDSTKVSR